MDELNAFISKHNTHYNNNCDIVIDTPSGSYIRVRLYGKFALCSPIDAATIALKKKKRDEYKLSEIFTGIKPINAMVKTNVPGFKQWCKVEIRKPLDGGLGYKVRNKSGRALRITPIHSKKTGRVFTIIDKIKAVKRV